MSRRFSIIALFAAWFCASGSMLNVIQVFAWARMFAGYTHQMSIEAAALETMDPGKPCPICRAIRRARDQSERKQPANLAVNVEKLVLVLHQVDPVVFDREIEAWPDAEFATPNSWSAPVPVPPPRGAADLET